MLNRQQCSSSNPCSEFGQGHSGCLSNLKSGQVGSSKYTLASEAAEGLENMYKDMPADVKNNLKISDSYRPLSIQCKIFDFDKFERSGKAVKKGTANTAAAKPGTSNHGWGRALDLSGPTAQKWIKENGPKYGWCWGEAKGEPWHFTFCGPGQNRYRNCDNMCKVSVSTSGSPPPTPSDQPTNTDSTSTSTSSSSSGSTETKTGSLTGLIPWEDLIFGKGFSQYAKTMFSKDKEKKDGEEKKPTDNLNTNTTLAEEVDRIKDLIRKVL